MSELTRPKFLTDLLAEVDGFDESLFSPPFEIEPKDKRIGELTDVWLRKLYATMRYYHRQGKLLMAEREDQADLQQDAELAEMKYKYDVLWEIFFAALRAEFNRFASPSIGLRKGWVVVESPADEDDDPIKAMFLAMLQKKRKKNE